MGKVYFSVAISLDGQVAGPNRGPKNPLGDRGTELHEWMYPTHSFRRLLHMGAGGETGPDDDLVGAIFERTGASIMGKRMFDEGEANWPEEAPFHTPVFVLTHEVRAPWERKGGTTFHFVTEGLEAALRQARKAAANRDVRIAGGAHTIEQFLNAGLVDEFSLAIAPMFLGDGLRLFDRLDACRVSPRLTGSTASPRVTHASYRVESRS